MATNKRRQISPGCVDGAMHTVKIMLEHRLEQKGRGTLASRHEILGVVTEEMRELEKAVEVKPLKDVSDELVDIAVGCIFGLACINARAVDW